MSTKLKFQKAQKLVPSEEHLDSREFILFDNNLYFRGDRAWFIVEDFMESDVNCVLRVRDIVPITTMEGDITASKVDDSKVLFSNGSQKLLLNVDQDVDAPPEGLTPLQPHEYQSLPEVLVRGREILSLMNEFTNCGVITIETETEEGKKIEEGYLTLLNQRVLSVLAGDPGLDIDLTEIPEVTKGIISQGVMVNLDKQIISCMLEEEDYKIYSSFKYAKCRFPEKHKKFAAQLSHGIYEREEDPSRPVITLITSVESFLSALPIVERMQHDGYAKFSANSESGKLTLTVRDSIKNTFDAEMDCEVSEDVNFESQIIDAPTVNYLCSAVGSKAADAQLVMTINPWKQRMILRVEPNENDVNALCMLKVAGV